MDKRQIKAIITDEEIRSAWGKAYFGNTTKRDMVRESLLKINAGFSTGNTIVRILEQLALISRKKVGQIKLTDKGKRYLYYAYTKNNV